MRVVILQPSYIPWLGFFDQLFRSDLFVVYDDVQYTKNDWRNRNRIRLSNGIGWLTIPVDDAGRMTRSLRINEVNVRNDKLWQSQQLKTLELNYKRAAYCSEILPLFESVLLKKQGKLIDAAMDFILSLLKYWELDRKIVFASSLGIENESRTGRLVDICKICGATDYISGNAALQYLDMKMFKQAKINVYFQDYKHPFYKQLSWGEDVFISHLSVLDILFNHGRDSLPILCGQSILEKPSGIKIMTADEYTAKKGI